MKDYVNLPFHPKMEKIVDILRKKTQNEDPVFFRLMVSYFFSKMASFRDFKICFLISPLLVPRTFEMTPRLPGQDRGSFIVAMNRSMV
jgi:hypothetical protein